MGASSKKEDQRKAKKLVNIPRKLKVILCNSIVW